MSFSFGNGAGPQEVGPHGQDDGHAAGGRGGGVQQAGEEGGAANLEPLPHLIVLGPVGEDFLELVDHDHQPTVLGFI